MSTDTRNAAGPSFLPQQRFLEAASPGTRLGMGAICHVHLRTSSDAESVLAALHDEARDIGLRGCFIADREVVVPDDATTPAIRRDADDHGTKLLLQTAVDRGQVVVALRTTGKAEYELYLAAPPELADGMSLHTLIKRALRRVHGDTSSDGLPLRSNDLAEWHAQVVNEEDRREAERFWKEQAMADSTPPSIDESPNRKVTTHPVCRLRLSSLEELTRAFAAQRVDAVLLACFSEAIAQVESAQTVHLAVVGNLRSSLGLADAIGPLTTALPLRLASRFNARAPELITAAHDGLELLDAWHLLYANQDCDHLPRYAFEYLPLPSSDSNASITVDDVQTRVGQFDVLLRCLSDGRDLSAVVEARHGAATHAALTIARRFSAILQSVVRHPGTPLPLHRLDNEASHAQAVTQWNDTAFAGDLGSIPHQVEQQFCRVGDRIAIVAGETHVSYAALHHRSNEVVRLLSPHLMGSETVVGIAMHRSPDLVAAILGVLAAGAVYLPLDPDHPADRNQRMLVAAGASCVIVDPQISWRPTNVPAVVLSRPTPATRTDLSEIRVLPLPGALAYILYTSGSTGRPKGAMNTHLGLANRLDWMQRAYCLTASDRVLQKTPISFDVSVWELLWPVCSGACLVLLAPGAHRNPADIVRIIAEDAITVVHFVPTVLRAFLEQNVEVLDSLRLLICSGEALPADLARQACRRLKAEVHNLYGPTEAAIDVTAWRCTFDVDEHSVPIGRPISNVSCLIVDDELAPLPAGSTGDLCIGGVALARGYVAAPSLTADRFVPDPSPSRPGARVYRTGDLARWLSQGTLQFIGRRDHQVKVGGVRVELGELETCLRTHPNVNDAVVVVRTTSAGDPRLHAYVVLNREWDDYADALRQFAARKLPAAFLPATLTALPSLPLTVSGKVNRAELPEHVAPLTDEQRSEAPQTRTERALARLWARVLDLPLDRVRRGDDFFRDGGDSILSLRFVGLAAGAGLNLTLPDLLQGRTLRQIASVVDARAGIDAVDLTGVNAYREFSLLDPEEHRLLPNDAEDAYPLTALQHAMLYHRELHQNASQYHDIFSFRVRFACDCAKLTESITRLVERHAALRTVFDLRSGRRPLQVVKVSLPPEVHFDDMRGASYIQQRSSITAALTSERSRGFDPEAGPLVRFLVHHLTENQFQFTFSFLHAVLDGWSVATLLTDLSQTYVSSIRGESLTMEPISARFAQAVALEQAAEGTASVHDFWRKHLNGNGLVMLPKSWSRGSDDTASELSIRHVSVQISAVEKERLDNLAHSAGTSLKSALLAIHLRVIAAVSNRSTAVTGIVSNVRPEQAGGDLVAGLLLNTVPLALRVERSASWIELIREVERLHAAVFLHRRLPLPAILKAAEQSAAFDTAFNFVNYHVYDALRATPGFEAIEALSFEQTSIPLLANFSLNRGADGGIRLDLAYDASRISEPSILTVADWYREAIKVATGDRNDAAYALLSTRPQQHLLQIEWNPPTLEEETIHPVGQVIRTAQNVADSVAVVCENVHVTYRGLLQKANEVANRLRAVGATTERGVAIAVENGPDLPAAVLGVLLTGAFYVPLDLDSPGVRLESMLERSGVVAVLTDKQRSLDISPLPWVVLSDKSISAEGGPLGRPADLQSLFYVIHTSGSSGRSKGVGMHAGPLARLLQWQAVALGTDRVRATQFARLAFDVSFQEMFSTWWNGGTLVIVPSHVRADPVALWNLVVEESIERLYLPVSMLLMVSELLTSPENCTLQQVITAGEALNVTPAVRLLLDATRASLHNMYGPTETHVATCYSSHATDCPFPPIGRPVDGTSAHVSSDFSDLLWTNQTGELLLGGHCLARGYYGDPALTAEKFLPDPFSPTPGSRVYRTGDVAYRHNDGTLQFVGRSDRQVKIRGFRVELPEIECALRQLSIVRQAAVLMSNHPSGDAMLVACVVCKEFVANDISRVLRDHLLSCLPAYMVPSDILVVQEIPTNGNGKTDWHKLQAIAVAARHSPTPRRDCDSELERALCGVFEELLGRSPISPEDHFFEMGGHSLLAMRVIFRLREIFKLDLPVRIIFDAATPALLSQKIEAWQVEMGSPREIGTI